MKKLLLLPLLFILLLNGCSNQSSSSENTQEKCKNPKIKGNLTTYNGEKIYHVPGGQFYDKTNAEEMFCTEDDAIKAGYRKSER
ncbi:sunset domain-containing protein [Heyndrickxia camelliae]|uniref:sunset domain-containing protein n=1 Tax=Heyndrickxia camelliae TaxID=1707093 RepID=UPI0026B73E56